MTENIINIATRQPAKPSDLDADIVPDELIAAFTSALDDFAQKVAAGEVHSLAIGSLNVDGSTTLFALGETGAEMVGLSAMLNQHTLNAMGFGP